MSGFVVPSFGFSSNNLQGLGSPKAYLPTSVYQPIPAAGTPSFGFGRPNTPKEHGRHPSYSVKDIEPTIQSVQPSVERMRRHREYYLEGGDIYFLVENYLFRVHRYFFERESPVFRKHFADSALNGHHRVGASDNEPLVLQDVKMDDFSRFLWVFYNPAYSIYDTGTEDWAAILGLAHHWQFSEVKALVVRELEKQEIPSIYKIVIYHRHSVDRGLLLPSYTDLVSREEALSLEEARDLGLETSLMIMTAREVVRKGEAPTSAVNVSPEELRSIIRHVFQFPGPRSDSPFSDITAAEPPPEHRSPPLVAEKTDLPTVHENEPITITASASLNSPFSPVTKPSVPVHPAVTPTPPAPAPSVPNKQPSSKPTPVTQKKEDAKPAPVNPAKESKEPIKPTPKQKDESKQNFQEPVKSASEGPPKPEAQDNKKPLLARLADVSKGAGGPASAKDKDGDKPTDNKGAKDAKDTADAKDVTGTPTPGQDLNVTPGGTPLANQDTDRPSTPSTGQSVLAKKTKALLARAGKIKRKEETDPSTNNKGKGKETPPIKMATASVVGSEHKGPEPGAKGTGTKAGVNGKGKEKVAGDEGKGKEKPVEVAGVDISKGSVKADRPGDEKKGDVGQDAKKPGEGVVGSSINVTPVTTDNTTKPISDNVKVTPPTTTLNKTSGTEVPSVAVHAAPGSDTPTTTADKKDDATKEKTTKPEEKVEPSKEKVEPSKEKVEPSKEKVEPFVVDEGDVATPRRATKELPDSPAKSLKEKHVPTLGLTVPKSPENGSAPPSSVTITGSTLSPLQRVLENTEDETLMERVARLKIGDASYQQPKDLVPPPQTDLESEFECETAPSGPGTPRSRTGRGSFSLVLRSDIPLSDDDDFFLDCDSNASVSNLDGV